MNVIRTTLGLLLIYVALACAEVDISEKKNDNPNHLEQQSNKPKEVEQQKDPLNNETPKLDEEIKEDVPRRHHNHGRRKHRNRDQGAHLDEEISSTDSPQRRRRPNHRRHHHLRGHQNPAHEGHDPTDNAEENTTHGPGHRRGRGRGHGKAHAGRPKNHEASAVAVPTSVADSKPKASKILHKNKQKYKNTSEEIPFGELKALRQHKDKHLRHLHDGGRPTQNHKALN